MSSREREWKLATRPRAEFERGQTAGLTEEIPANPVARVPPGVHGDALCALSEFVFVSERGAPFLLPAPPRWCRAENWGQVSCYSAALRPAPAPKRRSM